MNVVEIFAHMRTSMLMMMAQSLGFQQKYDAPYKI